MNSDNKNRCGWCVGDSQYEDYHDNEWGIPVYDDAELFEFLVLETFQTGLSWITILRKRENFRKAFNEFNYKEIANYNEAKIEQLLQDPGIVRHKLKIKATVSNAAAFIKVQNEFESFSKYIWSFTNGAIIKNTFSNYKDAPANTPLSETISKDLKKRGFKFVGPTVVYAYMQAIGIVNDHEATCFKYNTVR